MERGSMEKLKFDKRLARRRGWLNSDESKAYADALPDVADKCWVEEDEAEDDLEAATASAETASSSPETATASPEAGAPAAPVSESTPTPTATPTPTPTREF